MDHTTGEVKVVKNRSLPFHTCQLLQISSPGNKLRANSYSSGHLFVLLRCSELTGDNGERGDNESGDWVLEVGLRISLFLPECSHPV